MLLWLLLQRLPGYTREALESEPPHLVERWLILAQEEAAEAHRQAAKSAAKRG